MKHVRVERRGTTLEVTIDRPPANAITPEVSDDSTKLIACFGTMLDCVLAS